MTMRRLSRAEAQSRTREKLLAVAKTAFLRDGFAATSLEQITEAAGYSKGAVYSNFRSKDELCLAVLDQIRDERAASLAEAVRGLTSLDEHLAALRRWAERHVGDRAWAALEVEFGVHAARQPALARALADRSKALRARIATIVTSLADALGAKPLLPADDIGVLLLSAGVGLGMQRALEPAVQVRVLADLMRLLAGAPMTAADKS